MATHATGVTDLRDRRPRIDRQQEAERLLADHFAAIIHRHRTSHFRATIDICPDPTCATFVAYRTATA